MELQRPKAMAAVAPENDADPPFYPPASLPWRNPAWEKAIAVKGETEAQRKHALEVMASGMDTSIDDSWEVAESYGCADYYMIAVMLLFLLPQIIIFWPILFLLLALPVSLNLCYFAMTTKPGDEVVCRTGCRWTVHCILQFILSLPAHLVALVCLLYSRFLMILFGAIYCTFSCGWGRWCRNLTVISPHSGGPGLYYYFGDMVAAAGGLCYRQGYCEFMTSFTMMFVLNPWVKYWITGNEFLQELGERYITQIGKSMTDMQVPEIDDNFRKCISRARNTEANRREIDEKFFTPHYPYPPNGRRFALGMQHAGRITTFVHTTHFRSPEVADEGPVFGLSTSAELPVYRVMLWRNNPYHIYTGFVEASITNGMPSQPEKRLGGEHPMWLVNSHNKLAADRNVDMSIGWVDTFFDKFIPYFQHFIRLNVRGREEANKELAREDFKGFETANGL